MMVSSPAGADWGILSVVLLDAVLGTVFILNDYANPVKDLTAKK